MTTEWKPDLCIYHGGCIDGFGAAWAIWQRWGDDVEYVPGYYGKPLPDVTDKNVLFVDFSTKRDAMMDLRRVAKSIVVIDHHVTAEAELKPFMIATKNGLLGLPELLPSVFRGMAAASAEPKDHVPVVSFFDMHRSGATMAWEFANGLMPMPKMLRYIEDYDLWTFHFQDVSRNFSAGIRMEPMNFVQWNEIASDPLPILQAGQVARAVDAAHVAKIVDTAYFSYIDGHHVAIANAPYQFASEVGHELLKKYPQSPFAATWFASDRNDVKFSLRSEDSRLDVSEIAKKFGGGGHRNAAGFETGQGFIP